MELFRNGLIVCGTVVLATGIAAAAPADAPSPTVRKAFRRVTEIREDLERIRGKSFREPVSVQTQSMDDFRRYVRESVDRQFGPDGTRPFTDALVMLGAITNEVDLTSSLLALLESQAAAYYAPKKKTYFLLMTNMPALLLDMISSHELYHALQDQHHDLHSFLEEDVKSIRDNGDASQARQSLVEGEATFVMTAWMVERQAGQANPELRDSMVAMAISAQAAMDLDTIIAASTRQFQQMGPEVQPMVKAMEDLDTLPRFLVESLYAAYMQGGAMVAQVKARGGWKAVDALYRNPPQSTEQVLHPEKLAPETLDTPEDVRLPDLAGRVPAGWRLVEQDVLGELGARIYFGIWQDPDARDPAAAASAAAGWDGDRYYYFENAKTRGRLLVWKTVWDSTDEASEFAVAYRVTLRSRFPKARKLDDLPPSAVASQAWEVEPGRRLKLVMDGTTVGIVDTTDPALLNVWW